MKDCSAIPFNTGWKFLLGDPKNAQRKNYPDRTWKDVDLPHDWVISQPFNRGEAGSWTPQNMQGFFVWEGIAWYRKEFTLPNLDEKEVYIYFGGAYRNSAVYINGKAAGGRAYGYSSFELNISGFVKKGRNTIAVRLDNGCEAPDRWYSGSGLYRDVYLKITPTAHIKTWGVYAQPSLTGSVKVLTTLVDRNKAAAGTLNIQIKDMDGSIVAENSAPFNFNEEPRPKGTGYLRSPVELHSGFNTLNERPEGRGIKPLSTNKKNEIMVEQHLRIKNPKLWSAETPNLYLMAVCLSEGETQVNSKNLKGSVKSMTEVSFGFRKIDIVNRKGMIVNGQSVKLKGVCLHHDCGITGSAYYDAVWRRRLITLKDIGCNAIRTSHNPPSEEFLDLCDELGFYVIDECFDKWKSGYYAAHFDQDAQQDLESMILRDRNHPSVFMWSIGNEVENQGSPSMLEIQKKLAAIARSLDDRPVTCALSPHVNPKSLIGASPAELVKVTKKLSQDVDALGLNYHEPLYGDYTAGIGKPIVGTECYEYYSSTALNYEDVTSKNPWKFVLENDNVIGQFIWAGIDYLGESAWPAKGWSGSILDICGFMKPNAWFRKSIWTSEPMIYIALYDQSIKPDYARGRWSFPPLASHLNCDHFERRTVTAAIFTNCDEAELRINGKKMGRRNPADFENGIINWAFEYASGEVEVTGYRKGRALCSHALKTAGPASKILLTPDKTNLMTSGIAHVTITITDKAGIPCPHEELVDFSLTGDGMILGACSPDLNANLGFTLPKVITSGGKALAVIKSGGSPGVMELKAFSEKLKPASLRFKVKKGRVS